LGARKSTSLKLKLKEGRIVLRQQVAQMQVNEIRNKEKLNYYLFTTKKTSLLLHYLHIRDTIYISIHQTGSKNNKTNKYNTLSVVY